MLELCLRNAEEQLTELHCEHNHAAVVTIQGTVQEKSGISVRWEPPRGTGFTLTEGDTPCSFHRFQNRRGGWIMTFTEANQRPFFHPETRPKFPPYWKSLHLQERLR
ncbi:hypothetical protein GN956_G4689 [Arapaima gigas]